MDTMDQDQVLVRQMLDSSPRFRLLYEEHALLEKELRNIDSLSFLTPDDQIERKKVQKLKLAGKDEMFRMLSRARR